MSDAFNERLRLIRFRRRRERSRFRDELRIIPKWLIWMCVSLYIVALDHRHGRQHSRFSDSRRDLSG